MNYEINGRDQDSEESAERTWTVIPRSNITVGLVREALGIMADTALATVTREHGGDPRRDTRTALEAGWAAVKLLLAQRDKESEERDEQWNAPSEEDEEEFGEDDL